jgi:hypothetical protein
MKFNEELVKAGVMLAGEGLQPSSASGAFSGRSDRRGRPSRRRRSWSLATGAGEVHVEAATSQTPPNPMPGDSEIEIRPLFEMVDSARRPLQSCARRKLPCAPDREAARPRKTLAAPLGNGSVLGTRLKIFDRDVVQGDVVQQRVPRSSRLRYPAGDRRSDGMPDDASSDTSRRLTPVAKRWLSCAWLPRESGRGVPALEALRVQLVHLLGAGRRAANQPLALITFNPPIGGRSRARW